MAYTPPPGLLANFVSLGVPYSAPLGILANFVPGGLAPGGETANGATSVSVTTEGYGTTAFNAVGVASVGISADGHGTTAFSAVGVASVSITTEGYGTTTFNAVGAAAVGITAEGYGTVFAPVRGNVRSGLKNSWAKAAGQSAWVVAPQPATQPKATARVAKWVSPYRLNAEDSSGWVPSIKRDTSRRSSFGAFGPLLHKNSGFVWKLSRATDTGRGARWGVYGEMLNDEHRSRWVASIPKDARKTAVWMSHIIVSRKPISYARPPGLVSNFVVGESVYMPAPGAAANFYYTPAYETLLDGLGNQVVDISTRDTHDVIPWGRSAKRDKDTTHPWTKYSRPLNPGWGIVVPAGPTTPVDGETVTIPIQRVYIVINEIQLLRVSNMTPIQAINLNIGFDCDSWLPTFSATIPESARDAVMPDPSPVEIEASINGTQFRFFVERITRSRQFAQRSVTISGRGIACELDAPYATQAQHTNAIDMTAQQIITAALGFSGYTQTWNITDWLVPANTYSLYGTAAQVAGDVAEASGSVLAADWSLRDLRMMPRYPVKPWEWGAATPDFIIPGDVTQTESLEWIEKPSYNLVYVSGVQNGVLGQVKITGTAGDLPAPMLTHSLITHADAARQRGISILSDTGRKAMLQISMPVLESTGVIDVCKLIQFNDGVTARRGIVRANNISVNWPTVRQVLTVEAAA